MAFAAAAATTASTAATAAMAAAAATSAAIFTSMHAYGGDHDALQSAGTMAACMMVVIIIVRGLRAGGPCSGDENDEKNQCRAGHSQNHEDPIST